MPARRSHVIATTIISAIATGALILAIVGSTHHSWGVVGEGLAAAVLLYGLVIHTSLRRRQDTANLADRSLE